MPGLTGLSGLSGLSGSHGGPYHEKILDYNPIVLFPLWEAAGAQADEIANGWNGTHVGVTLGQPGLGDGYTSPWYDGAADYTNIFTAGFQAAFDGNEGSIIIWGKVHNVGVWTDGQRRQLLILAVDANNYIVLEKSVVNNRLVVWRVASTVPDGLNIDGLTTIDWFCLGLTWSTTLDELRVYLNGLQSGATQNTLSAWVGLPTAVSCVIGASITTPANIWHGWLEYGAIFDYSITPAGMAELGTLVGGVL